MFTNTFRDAILETPDGTNLTAWTPYAGLLTAITSFRTPTVTEATYTGYARQLISLGAVGNTSPAGGRQKANDAIVSFPQNTGTTQDVLGMGFYTAVTSGLLYAIGTLDTDPPVFGTADTADLITAPAHGLQADQRVYVLAAPGAVIPAGLSEGTAYFVLATGLTTDAFKLSTSSGGGAVDITASGAALFIPYKAVTIAALATPEFAVGTLKLQI